MPGKTTMMGRHRAAGTSLIELLVVIVILLIGILGVIQIFPGGLGILRTTRNNSIATELARSQSDELKGRASQLPEMILGTTYDTANGTVVNIAETQAGINDLLPAMDGMTSAGLLTLGGNDLGLWDYLTGANMMRRVVGEGGPVPAPRRFPGPSGFEYGGLLVLQFSPIVYDPAYPILLLVYGNDMSRREGSPGFAPSRPWQFFLEDVDTPAATIHVPRDTVKPRSYRLSFTAWIDNGGTTEPREIVDTIVTVPANASGGYEPVLLSAYAGPGPFLGAEFNSVRLARLFDQVANSAAFTSDPYECVLLDSRLGVLLFNPRGYNYLEPRQGNRRIPLTARVNYDVYDWRIIRDEFRIPGDAPYQTQLKLGGLKVKGSQRPDGQTYQGLNVLVADGAGGTQDIDLILHDVETGGVFLHDPTNPANPSPPPTTFNDYLSVDPARSSYAVDKSTGFIRFLDFDPGTPGMQLRIIYPGTAAPQTINADGRVVRALYEANGEWAVQVMKAPSTLRQVFSSPQRANFYVGGTSPLGGLPTRIYFPPMDAGKNVTIGEIWYTDGGGSRQVLRDQNFVIQATPFDPIGPYVEIRNLDPTAVGFEFSNGYAVRYVRGASVRVRVLWNAATFDLFGGNADRLDRFERWSRNWRRVSVDTFLQRGEH